MNHIISIRANFLPEKIIILYYKILILMTLRERRFENIVEKEENAGEQHFFLFLHN